jgi:hypothetical protein
VNIAINTQIAMLAFTADRKAHGLSPQNATRPILISSSALILFNAVHQHIAGMCLRPIEGLM